MLCVALWLFCGFRVRRIRRMLRFTALSIDSMGRVKAGAKYGLGENGEWSQWIG